MYTSYRNRAIASKKAENKTIKKPTEKNGSAFEQKRIKNRMVNIKSNVIQLNWKTRKEKNEEKKKPKCAIELHFKVILVLFWFRVLRNVEKSVLTILH